MKQDIESGFKKKTRRKLILQFLCWMVALALTVGMFPICAESSGKIGFDSNQNVTKAADYSSAVTMTDWYNGTVDQVENTFISIESPAELEMLSEKVNQSTNENKITLSGYVFFLTKNLDMTDVSFTPIGVGINAIDKVSNPTKSFCGKFDGRGYVIDNLKPTASGNDNTVVNGLFGALGSGATIQNLVIGRGCEFKIDGDKTNAWVGSVAARACAGVTIQNVLNLGTVIGGNCSGGLVGRTNGYGDNECSLKLLIQNSANYGPVYGNGATGGIVGYVNNNIQIDFVRNDASVSSSGYLGGMIGNAGDKANQEYTIHINNSKNNGELTGTKAGGLIGFLKDEEGNCVCTVSDSFDYSGCAKLFYEKTTCEYSKTPDPATDASIYSVQFHGYQTKDTGNNTMSIRLIGSVDSKDTYTAAGFYLTNSAKQKVTKNCTTLFSSLLALENDEQICYYSEQLCGTDGYFFALVITNVPTNVSIPLTVQAFATSASGTRTSEEFQIVLNK